MLARHAFPIVLLLLSLALAFGYEQSEFKTRNLEPYVYRPSFCKDFEYRNLPNATIIITALNEETSMLESNIQSILSKTPPALLDSIIVVDDDSEFLPVSPSILRFPKVQLVRTDSPKGVAGARMVGAAKGNGQVLVFLDSQMEVTERWLEPLLQYVSTHKRSAAAAIIESIDEEGAYDSVKQIPLVTVVPKTLDFKWTTPVQDSDKWILYSPVLLGSAFAISREWFDEGGKYDPGNRVWGTENVELSVRVWTCGGDVVFMPCSRLGHYYRSWRKYKSPRFETDFVQPNAIRFAEVWLDEFAQDFYLSMRSQTYEYINKHRTAPDLMDRKMLRQQMKCKPFSWYYRTVLKGTMEMYNITVPGVAI